MAHIANQKYCLALPLYRQEQEFSRNNLNLSRQTMANWLIYVSQKWLTPIYNLLKENLVASSVIHADETSVQVLKELSNNRAERSIKPFVIGRKNWIFANTPKGATASSVLYSIIETAKENGIKPYEYLKFVFETAPNIAFDDAVELQRLLPWNAPDVCKMPEQLSF